MSSNDPDQIRQDIERTRANLSYDVNALADEANPKNVAQRQADKALDGVRSGIRNVKEQIMGTDDRNYGEPSAADKARFAAEDAKYAVGEKVEDAKYAVGEKVEDAKQAVGEKADQARAMAQQAPHEVKRQVRGNPLAAGLVAFGLGSIIGSLFPATRYESQAADAIKDKAQPLVDEVKGMAQDAAEQVRPAAQQAVEEVKQVAQEAKQHVTDQAQAAKENTTQQAADAKDNVQYVREQEKNNNL